MRLPTSFDGARRIAVRPVARPWWLACFAATFGLASPAFAYRTAADAALFADVEERHAIRWQRDEVRVVLRDHALPGARAAVEAALGAALRSWGGVDCLGLDLRLAGVNAGASQPGDGVVTVEWVEDWAGRGFRADAAATTDVLFRQGAGGDWEIADADILLDARKAWSFATPPPPGARSVEAVLAHELGHVLGLEHPCELDGADAPRCNATPGAEEALMYPIYGETVATPQSDDQAGLCALYGACLETCGAGARCVEGLCIHPCGAAECVASEVCTPDGCVRPSCERLDDPGCEALAPLGDPCAAHGDCASSFCGDGGFCVQACGARRWCPGDAECTSVPGAVPECAPARGVFGDPCTDGSQCASDLCVGGDEIARRCTRACGAELAVCPAGQRCRRVDGVDVCAPPPIDGGCAVTTTGLSAPPVGIWLFGLSLLLLRRRR